jgi:hypothetical protein
MWKASGFVAAGAPTLSLRCPECRQHGTFENLGVQDIQLTSAQPNIFLGLRRCPNVDCRSALFVVHSGAKIIKSFPPETIDFDSTNIPAGVVGTFEEAIKCHANQCFIAAAIMVRKTLEELCRDRQAAGGNLKERIRALGTKIVLPQELLDGLDDLRLLGNDAAHIESQEYGKIGKDEVEVGMEFTKEVLKAVFQYSTLLSRLRALKKNP